jgi:UDP-glucose 4-epimerase
MRFFNVYGRRQDPSSPYSGVISIFARLAARGEPITLHGDGGQTRDFVHVRDVVAHLVASMDTLHAAPGAGILNVCTGTATSIAALARLIAEVAGTCPAIGHGPARAGDIRRSVGDPAAARGRLKLAARVELADGLLELLG